ncbi:MAG TPA: phospholipase D family protein [Gemmataceae bacterium]|nr:phospholipase D family protein [Gemmataceae bacterium]
MGDDSNLMTWLLLATGFTGALTLVFLLRALHRRFSTPPSVTAFFSPKGGCTDAIVHELKAARREILVQAYSFSSKAIAQALVDAKTRGLKVEVLLDRSNEQEEYSDLKFFTDEGLVPLIDAEHAIAHNKVIVIDGKTVLTGSFNFTHQAEADNAENLLILKGHPELAHAYRANFEAHKAHSQSPGKAAGEHAAHRRAA